MDSLETYTYLSAVTTMHFLPREIEMGLIYPPLKKHAKRFTDSVVCLAK